jgi:hypothetical protein
LALKAGFINNTQSQSQAMHNDFNASIQILLCTHPSPTECDISYAKNKILVSLTIHNLQFSNIPVFHSKIFMIIRQQ